jgi:magnesium chelatase family protein
MNPCPCGYLGDASGRCHCSEDRVRAYRGRLSGPLLDRIDMHVEVPAVPRELLLAGAGGGDESSAAVQGRVCAARERALARSGCPNHALSNQRVAEMCALDAESRGLLEQAIGRLGLSARAFHRILKVARTIADLAGAERLAPAHLSEAIQYRRLDRRPAMISAV